jgi:hypothetical protein
LQLTAITQKVRRMVRSIKKSLKIQIRVFYDKLHIKDDRIGKPKKNRHEQDAQIQTLIRRTEGTTIRKVIFSLFSLLLTYTSAYYRFHQIPSVSCVYETINVLEKAMLDLRGQEN